MLYKRTEEIFVKSPKKRDVKNNKEWEVNFRIASKNNNPDEEKNFKKIVIFNIFFILEISL